MTDGVCVEDLVSFESILLESNCYVSYDFVIPSNNIGDIGAHA